MKNIKEEVLLQRNQNFKNQNMLSEIIDKVAQTYVPIL